MGRATTNARAVARCGGDADPAAVGADHGGHDGQTEPGAALLAVPGRVGAVEPLEHVGGGLGGHARALVGHLDDGVGAVDGDPDRHRRRLRGVDPGVREQVGHDLVEAHVVAADDDRARGRLEGDGPVGLDGTGVGHGVVDEGHQVDGLAFEGAALVETGEEQEVVDEHAHPRRLVLDPAHGEGQLVGVVGGAPPEQLGVAADGGERGAQLVGGVGDEPAQALLRARRARRRTPRCGPPSC